jgi:hypothetical protein
MTELIAGASMTTLGTIGLFFWKFGKKSGDRFYVMFAAAFWILALNQVMSITNVTQTNEHLPIYYVVRFLAFSLILLAIIDKNHSK